jgi:hypothetical protein
MKEKWLAKTGMCFGNGSVYYPQRGNYPEACASLLPTAKHRHLHATSRPGRHMLYATSVPKACSMFSSV